MSRRTFLQVCKKIFEIKGNLYIWIRIRIQQLKLMRKIAYPCGSGSETSIKDVQATGTGEYRALRNMKFIHFLYFCGPFLPSWIRIRIANPYPDPIQIRIRSS
jgi:hypothetical protein